MSLKLLLYEALSYYCMDRKLLVYTQACSTAATLDVEVPPALQGRRGSAPCQDCQGKAVKYTYNESSILTLPKSSILTLPTCSVVLLHLRERDVTQTCGT